MFGAFETHFLCRGTSSSLATVENQPKNLYMGFGMHAYGCQNCNRFTKRFSEIRLSTADLET